MFGRTCYDTFWSCLTTYLIMYVPGVGFTTGAYLIWKKEIIGSTNQTIEKFIYYVDEYSLFLILAFIGFTSVKWF